MNKKNLILVIFSIFIVSCNNNYKIDTKFNIINNKSTIYLLKNGIKIDSINNISNFYGKNSIVNIEN